MSDQFDSDIADVAERLIRQIDQKTSPLTDSESACREEALAMLRRLFASAGHKEPPDFALSSLNFSIRTRNALRREGVKTVNELCQYTSDQILDTRDIGITSLHEIRQVLSTIGRSLHGDCAPTSLDSPPPSGTIEPSDAP